jgi:hypothetical protein
MVSSQNNENGVEISKKNVFCCLVNGKEKILNNNEISKYRFRKNKINIAF